MSFAGAGRPLMQALTLRANYAHEYPVLAALLKSSQENEFISVELQRQLKFNGEYRQIIANYYAPTCDPIGDCADSVCTTGTILAPSQATLSITKCTASKVYGLNVDDVRLVDGSFSFSDHAMMQFLSTLSGVRKSLASSVAAWLTLNAGVHNDGTAAKAISFTDPSSAALRPLGLWEIQREFSDLGLTSPYIVGGADVFTWKKAVEFGGLNANGLQVGQLGSGNMYYDALIEDAAADATKGHVIAYDPQMVKFVSYGKNADMFATSPLTSLEDLDRMFTGNNDYMFGSIIDPVTGLIFDLDVMFNPCSKAFTYQWRIQWDIYLMPNYFCANAGVNGIFKYTTCLSTPTACP